MPLKPKIVSRFLRTARRRAHNAKLGLTDIQSYFGFESVQSIYNWENDDSGLTLKQLQRAADFYGLPAGVVLCITRITSDFRDGKADDAVAIARGLRVLADHVLEQRDRLANRDYDMPEMKERDGARLYSFSPLEQTLIDLWDVYKPVGLYRPQWPDPDIGFPNSES